MSQKQWQPTFMRQLLREWINRLRDIWTQQARQPQFPALEAVMTVIRERSREDNQLAVENVVEQDVDQLWEEMAQKLNEMVANAEANQLLPPMPEVVVDEPVVQLDNMKIEMNPMVANFFQQLDEQLANAKLGGEAVAGGQELMPDENLLGAVGGAPAPVAPAGGVPIAGLAFDDVEVGEEGMAIGQQHFVQPNFWDPNVPVNQLPDYCPICRCTDESDSDPIVQPCFCPGGYHMSCLIQWAQQDNSAYEIESMGLRCPNCHQLLNDSLIRRQSRRPTNEQFNQYCERRCRGRWPSVQRRLGWAVSRWPLAGLFLPALLMSQLDWMSAPVYFLCIIVIIGVMMATRQLATNWSQNYNDFYNYDWYGMPESLPIIEFLDYNLDTNSFEPGAKSYYDPLPNRQLQQIRRQLEEVDEQISLVMADLADNFAVVDQQDDEQQRQYHERHQVLNYWREERQRLLRENPELSKYQ